LDEIWTIKNSTTISGSQRILSENSSDYHNYHNAQSPSTGGTATWDWVNSEALRNTTLAYIAPFLDLIVAARPLAQLPRF
jgi:hypothetical protein